MEFVLIQIQKRDQPFLLVNLEALAQHSFLGFLHSPVDPADLAGLAFQDFPESGKKSQVIFIIVCSNALRHGVNERGIPTIVP